MEGDVELGHQRRSRRTISSMLLGCLQQHLTTTQKTIDETQPPSATLAWRKRNLLMAKGIELGYDVKMFGGRGHVANGWERRQSPE
jgi:hypothetical protein